MQELRIGKEFISHIGRVQQEEQGCEILLVSLPKGIPTVVSVDSKTPSTLEVQRGGLITEGPQTQIQAYVPEGNISDIPRTLALHSSKEWVYWEEAGIPTPQKQRPPRIKYLITSGTSRWYIETLSRSSYSRKIREAERKLRLCGITSFGFTGIILIAPRSFSANRIDPGSWPLDVAICHYTRD